MVAANTPAGRRADRLPWQGREQVAATAPPVTSPPDTIRLRCGADSARPSPAAGRAMRGVWGHSVAVRLPPDLWHRNIEWNPRRRTDRPKADAGERAHELHVSTGQAGDRASSLF